jgi:hypothetical protein
MSELTNTDIAWEILYNEKLDSIPDPNKPENTAHINAVIRENRERLKKFVNGPGKVLVDRWKEQIRKETLGLIVAPEEDCNCGVCKAIRVIRNKFELILEAEKVLREDNLG